MKARIEILPEHGMLQIVGRFDLHAMSAFRTAFRRLLAECRADKLIVDMASTDYMDSSALGMLLEFRADAEKRDRTIVLQHCNPFIRNMLHTVQFHRLFFIDNG